MYELTLELVGTDSSWSFITEEVSIGRDPNCDLVLPTQTYPMVSRSHLLIRLAADRYWVDDLNSSGGTFVNGARVGVMQLKHGDIIQLGEDGPELKVTIGISQQPKSHEKIPKKRSLSNEDATKFR